MALGKSAAGQALGYLYQFERALYWLSDADVEYVSIETDDDVVSQLKEGKEIGVIYEQDKSVTGKSNPFANSSSNLWKTLSIWLALQRKYLKSKSRFVLSTNKRVSSTCIMYKLHKANFESGYKTKDIILEAFYHDLIGAGTTSKGKAKEYFTVAISTYTKEEFINLLSKIVLSSEDFQNDKNKFKNSIKENLRIGAQVPFNSIYDKIMGWLVGNVIELWSKNKEGIVRASELINVKDVFIKEALEKPFIEQAISAIPVFSFERDEQKNKDFIKQLELIEVAENEKIEAIDDFLRASKERDRWAENGTIPCQDDINNLENDLKRTWGKNFKRNLITAKAKPELSAVDVGNLIYLDCSDYSGFHLAGYPVIQPYTIIGGLHILSNKLNIGWHPNWQKHFKVTTTENES